MTNKHKIIWGGYKNTTIPKMLREAFDPDDDAYRSGGGSYSGFTIPTPEITETTHIPETTTPGNLPLTVNFGNRSTGDDLEYLWNFGDGNTSTDINPEHTYTTAGIYTVKLTVTNVMGSDTKIATGAVVAIAETTTSTTDEPPSPEGSSDAVYSEPVIIGVGTPAYIQERIDEVQSGTYGDGGFQGDRRR